MLFRSDHILVNKLIYGLRLPDSLFGVKIPGVPWGQYVFRIEPVHRGDVVVFVFPPDPTKDFIKRVIGLPGDTIELKKKRVYVNGTLLDEPYVRYLSPPEESSEHDFDVRVQYGPVTVPEDQYFMMGDNRDNSQDSRYWGFMPRSYVKGKALFVYFSFNDGGSSEAGGGLSQIFSTVRWNRLLHQIH